VRSLISGVNIGICPKKPTFNPDGTRRYALFTLVGIAGEDDLDAPDLISPSQPVSGRDRVFTGSG